MAIEIKCPKCNTVHRAPDDRAGQTGRCKCGENIVIPSSPEQPTSPANHEAAKPTSPAPQRSATSSYSTWKEARDRRRMGIGLLVLILLLLAGGGFAWWKLVDPVIHPAPDEVVRRLIKELAVPNVPEDTERLMSDHRDGTDTRLQYIGGIVDYARSSSKQTTDYIISKDPTWGPIVGKLWSGRWMAEKRLWVPRFWRLSGSPQRSASKKPVFGLERTQQNQQEYRRDGGRLAVLRLVTLKEKDDFVLKIVRCDTRRALVHYTLTPSGVQKAFTVIPIEWPIHLYEKDYGYPHGWMPVNRKMDDSGRAQIKKTVEDIMAQGYDICLVKQNGQWKIDLQTTLAAVRRGMATIMERRIIAEDDPAVRIASVFFLFHLAPIR